MRKFKFTLLIYFITFFFNATAQSLVHHWNFDEGPDWHDDPYLAICNKTVATDIIGNSHATLTNMNSSNWVSGRQYTALKFNGQKQYLSTKNDLSKTLGYTATLSFWIKTTQKGKAEPNESPTITGSIGEHNILWGAIDEVGRIGISTDNDWLIKSDQSITDDEWHHIVLTRNHETGIIRIYVDNKLSSEAKGATGDRRASVSTIGCATSESETSNYFSGTLDQIHIYNYCCDSVKVNSLFNNHAPKSWTLSVIGDASNPFITPSVLSRVFDVERDSIYVYSFTQPTMGNVKLNSDGSFLYSSPAVNNDHFFVTVSDGNDGFFTSRIDVEVNNIPAESDGIAPTRFNNLKAIQANGIDISSAGWRVPRAIDWNKDGLTDILVSHGENIFLYVNTGSKTSPAFASGITLKNSDLGIISSGRNGTTSFCLIDINGNKKEDLILAGKQSNLIVYQNKSTSGEPVFDSSVSYILNTEGENFVLPDPRFDMGDWDGDGLADLIAGTYNSKMQLYLNKGTATEARFDQNDFTVIQQGSYNFYPRLFDLNQDGSMDFLRCENWGSVFYWKNVSSQGLNSRVTLNFLNPDGTLINLKLLTDGAIVDFGDFNDDGVLDIIFGGHKGTGVYMAYGIKQSLTQCLNEIETIYNAHTTDLGIALSENDNKLLTDINDANRGIISILTNGSYAKRKSVYETLKAHINKYPFLKYQEHDVTKMHHIPSIIAQNWVMLHYALPDNPDHRKDVADAIGLSGTAREIYELYGIALGDNAKSKEAAYKTIKDFLLRHPKELFPDALISFDRFYGDGNSGFIWSPTKTKNTFGDWALRNANEWASDLTNAINKELGNGSANGDYFTFVMGHEVSHSMDNYINTRSNKDLRRRWGLYVVNAAGKDIIPNLEGNDGWWNLEATKNNFKTMGYWDGVPETWNTSWNDYWTSGPGGLFKSLSIMRIDVKFFLTTRQESLATQGNHHWANGKGRLIGAYDRFQRAGQLGAGYEPMKANINEVVHFIDFLSAGMNRVNLVETKNPTRSNVEWTDHYATLERDDTGLITRISVEGLIYNLIYNKERVVIDVNMKSSYSITFNENGADAGSMQPQIFASDDEQRLSVNNFTREGYAFINWNTKPDGTGISYENEQSLVLNNNMTLYAQWERIRYTIRVDQTENGTIYPFTTTVNMGENLILNIIPDDGYVVDEVFIDGTSIGAASSYTFEKVSSPHTISATFTVSVGVDTNDDPSYKVYNKDLNIYLKNADKIATLCEIIDVSTSRRVAISAINCNLIEVAVPKYGVYIVKLTYKDKEVSTRKLIVK